MPRNGIIILVLVLALTCLWVGIVVGATRQKSIHEDKEKLQKIQRINEEMQRRNQTMQVLFGANGAIKQHFVNAEGERFDYTIADQLDIMPVIANDVMTTYPDSIPVPPVPATMTMPKSRLERRQRARGRHYAG